MNLARSWGKVRKKELRERQGYASLHIRTADSMILSEIRPLDISIIFIKLRSLLLPHYHGFRLS